MFRGGRFILNSGMRPRKSKTFGRDWFCPVRCFAQRARGDDLLVFEVENQSRLRRDAGIEVSIHTIVVEPQLTENGQESNQICTALIVAGANRGNGNVVATSLNSCPNTLDMEFDRSESDKPDSKFNARGCCESQQLGDCVTAEGCFERKIQALVDRSTNKADALVPGD